MADKFDEMAVSITDGFHAFLNDCGVSVFGIRGSIAQALRDVERETAEECARICEQGKNDNEPTCRSICHTRDIYAIKEHFGLKD